MEFEQVIKKRRMIREFDSDKQIPENIITKLIRNAHRMELCSYLGYSLRGQLPELRS